MKMKCPFCTRYIRDITVESIKTVCALYELIMNMYWYPPVSLVLVISPSKPFSHFVPAHPPFMIINDH